MIQTVLNVPVLTVTNVPQLINVLNVWIPFMLTVMVLIVLLVDPLTVDKLVLPVLLFLLLV